MSEYIGDIYYNYGRSLYINMTNLCCNRCEFCIRNMADSLGSADSLWLKREPKYYELIEGLEEINLNSYDEIVFCGYGEPTERIDDLINLTKEIKSRANVMVRINTNGLGNLINGYDITPLLENVIDSVSVSLNATDAASYNDLCHPKFGLDAYPALIEFTQKVKKHVPDVRMSVVSVISTEDIKKCERIANDLGVKFRVR
ncbi:MAG TPA: TatD family nuclease-associated radical SAM protein [Anaerovoracaceae bacterium]|nr:TatD family nuclease-associated radical SAM protein [Anaerovoracaceae bacterium]